MIMCDSITITQPKHHQDTSKQGPLHKKGDLGAEPM